ncbi:MAG: hypothetical protein Fur0022_44630 [Anaerolineales bacterium]
MKLPHYPHRLAYAIITFLFILSQFVPLLSPALASPQSPISNLEILSEDESPTTQLLNYPIAQFPLSLSRVQTSYTAGQTTIEFTLTNNLPATRVPEISDTATATETVDLLASFIVTDDVNTLRGITLADTLAAGTTLLDASGNPSQAGNTLTWALPDLPPQASTTVTLTVQTPAQGANFVNLDTGAQANAEQWGEPVSTTAPPAVLIPTGIDAATTLPTVDANSRDADMLWKSAEFGQDALAMFAYVQSLGYEAYEGSLRGTRGTLWGEAGNSADKASLLIAMLRAAGVPARYRHGSLNPANAQTLIASMFPAQAGIAGSIPDGTPVSDPLNDPTLLALVTDHWWVEAYLPDSGWTNLDPSFADAQPGDVFATPGANDRIAELPANTRQQVTFELEVEQYNSFPIGGVYLSTFTPLVATFSVPELASKAVTFGHMVVTDVQGGIYSNVIHTYTPYFAVGGDDVLYFGDEFQDLLTTFPLATHFTTAEWLHVTITAPNGQVTDSFTRELKDLIGLDVRLNGGSPTITLPEDNAPFATGSDLFASWFLPNEVNNLQYAERAQTENMRDVIATAITADNLPEDLNTPEGSAAFSEMFLQYLQARNEQYALAGLEFAKLADPANGDIEQNLHVNLVYEKPRIIITSSQEQADDTVLTAMDLRSTEAKIWVGPGQAQAAAFTAQWMKAVGESYFEGDAIYRLTGEFPLTISRIFDEMGGQGIHPVWITPSDMNLLTLYFPDSASVAHAKQALIEGKSILIPSAPVTIDGEPVLGWWEVDPQTGMVDSVSESGLHLSAVEYEMIANLVDFLFLLKDGLEIQESVKKLWTCIAKAVVPALQGNPGAPVDCLDGWSPPGPSPQTLSWRYLPAYLCPVDNCGIEQFMQNYPDRSPIPLPDIWMGYTNTLEGDDQAARTLEVSDNGGGGGPTFALSASPNSGTVLPGETFTFDLSASANFDGLVDAWVYAPDGWVAAFDETSLEGQITLKPGALPGDYTLTIVGQAREFPDVFTVIEMTITVPNAGDLTLAWEAEPNLTVPTGAAMFDAVSNETNDGETEVPNAAYRLDVANLSGQEKTLTLSVSGAPAGWIILNGARQTTAQFDLAPNARAHVGLYVSPPTLPAPGTNFSMNVTVSDGTLSDAETINWAMPSQPFNYLTTQPTTIYLGSDSSTDFTVSMTNVGNADGTFPISAITPPITATISNLQSPISLAVGETQSFNATLHTTGIPLGARFPIVLGSPAPGSYTQYAVVNAQIISEITEPVFIASDNAANACTLGEPGLSAALESLALAMVHLEASCLNGDCNLSLRDQTVNAAYSVAVYASGISTGITQDDTVIAVADELASHTENPDILADLQNLSDAVVALDAEVCAWSASMPDLTWSPYYNAALISQPATYTLNLTNLGTLATTYNLTVTLPSGTQTFNPTVNSGETSSYEFPASSPIIDLVDLSATVTVADQPAISDSANALLNVVDKFVQLTNVTAAPPFVETGVSSTDLSIGVTNNANILQPATAYVEILHPSGAVQYTDEYPVSILVGSPRNYALDTVDTSGWDTGVYTITVELRNSSGDLIPDGAGYGYLGVGQTVGITHAVEPVIAAPGAVTVTTIITTEILVDPLPVDQLSVDQLPGTDQPINQSPITDHQSTDQPINQSPITDHQSPASTYAITRTEDTNPAITYTGIWTVVSGITTVRSSNSDHTWADAAGEKATFTFDGTWLHLGFVTVASGGQADILVDGVSQGIVDTYARENGVKSYVFAGFTDTTHTLEIVVTGTRHPNSTGFQVRLDYIDTWDGTLYPDGLVEQDSPRIWKSGDTVNVIDPNASGGSYMQDGGHNSSSVWFPFTGDSVTFLALANDDGFRTSVYIDGVWKENLWMYHGTPISRTLSFDGLGPGPHVMQISNYFLEPNTDAFITPAIEPGYIPPDHPGIVRYEEDHPALLYNGYPFTVRKSSWFRNTATSPTTSDVGNVESQTLNDNISLTFDGRWVSLGFTGRTNGGLAEVFIDGTSYGTVNTYNPIVGRPMEFQFGNLITGTHTISITVLDDSIPPSSGTVVFFDYIDVWDGAPMSGDIVNVEKGEPAPSLHFNKSGTDALHPNAINGDFFASGLPNSAAGVWYSFIGSSVTIYGLTRNNTTSMDVFIDGQFIETVNFDYPYSEQTFARHYTGLTDGPHTLRVHNVATMRLDAFASNQPAVPYQPIAEWWDNTPAGSTGAFGTPAGMLMGIAAGDVDGDGLTEIVAPSDTFTTSGFVNSIFIFRGDGGDTGDGDPIISRIDFPALGFGVGREYIGSVALADLDGQPGSEIIIGSERGMYAFSHTGITYWFTDTFFGNNNATIVTPVVGNLDLDAAPEIVVNLGNTLVVYNADGSIAWSQTYASDVGMPVLADMNGDGLLDILSYDVSGMVRVYNFNYGSPQLLWQYQLSSIISIVRGGPAVADVNGDGFPDLAISHDGAHTVLDHTGNLVWSTPLDPGASGGVSIADIDGDGEIEIVTGMMHNDGIGIGRLYALNADGSILWERPAYDDTSANSQSVLDVDGDGVYEIAWNGAQYGFTIFNGADGEILFQEPLAESLTATDYPIFADVDSDGYAEIVVPSNGGLVVFGQDGIWGQSRPLWNQHSYHITNINDDLTVPFSEPNSWDVHNTYRTQTTNPNPLPSYAIALTHTVGLDNVTVLTSTFNLPPSTSNPPAYGWDYSVTWENTVVTQTFTSLLTNLQPGESRMVAQGTTADYVAPGGTNHLELPPLFVSVVHIIALDPVTQTVGVGGSATFEVILTNPSGSSALFNLTASGFPTGWATLSGAVPVPANSSVTVPLTVDVPADAETLPYTFQVNATTDQGWADQAGGVLTVANLLELAISPENQTVTTGEVATYTLAVTNLDGVARTYTLSGAGLAPLTLPAEVTVSANSTAYVAFSAQAVSEGANPFTVIATEENGAASGQDTASVTGEGFQQVEVAIIPASAPTGPGVLTSFNVRITNLGTVPDTYDLTAAVPANWEATLTLFGQPVSAVDVAPGAENAVTVLLRLTPASDAPPGDYTFSVTAQSLVADTGEGLAQVGNLGVSVELSGPTQVSGSGAWDVIVTNNGIVADTYALTVFGPFAQFAQLSQTSVSLPPGASQTVQLTTSGFGWLATDYLLGVHAQSQTQSYVQDEDALTVSIIPVEGVAVDWQPNEQTINGVTQATFTLIVTNTGNIQTTYNLSSSAPSRVDVQLPSNSVVIPAFSSAVMVVVVIAPGNGTFPITVTATSVDAQGSDTATLIVEGIIPPQFNLYLPILHKN